jgi:mono/diheme cytochrome c family protein
MRIFMLWLVRPKSLRAFASAAALALSLALQAATFAAEPSASAPRPAASTDAPKPAAAAEAPKPAAPKPATEAAPPPPPPSVPAVADPAIAEQFTHLRSPQESMATIQLPPGYHLQLIAAEPDIISPVCMAWDGNGVLYVCEMRTYMLDVDGGKTMEPKSRVSRWESTKGDGVYDKHTVFVDNLLLPRQVLPLDDGRVLIRETNSKDIYAYRDTNNDGVSDEKTEFYKAGEAKGNLEHQSSHLTWNIDNWMYQTVDGTRFRLTGDKLTTSQLPFKTGQWGYAVDDTGRMIFATAGAERPAHDFQAPLIYGKIALPGELADKFTEVYGLVKLTDMQGGPLRIAPGGGLNRFTGCAGPCIYRGDALPKDLYGDYILPEPVGRIVRRAKVNNVDGKIVLANAYENKEFLASTDANFRPVFSATGPDGCLYFLDMYHGIIQESNWTKEGTFLRKEIQRYGLDKHINAGRIYRLVHDDFKPHFERPHMLSESPAELVKHLTHPNGWWRDEAQKLIVLKGDKSVVPALKAMATSEGNAIARLHALWTLDGLDATDESFVIEKLHDADGRVRAAAVRIAEPLIRKNVKAIMTALAPIAADPDPNVAKQYCLSLLYTEHPDADALIKAAVDAHPKNTAIPDVVKGFKISAATAKADKIKPPHLDRKYAVSFSRGKEMFAQTCIACHGLDGKGTPAPEGNGLTLAPPLKGSPRLLADKVIPINLVLHGLTGPHENGKLYPNEMAGFPWADDQLVADVLTYARNDFGNKGAAIENRDVYLARRESEKHTLPYTFPEISEMIAKLPTPPATPAAPKRKPAAAKKMTEAEKIKQAEKMEATAKAQRDADQGTGK